MTSKTLGFALGAIVLAMGAAGCDSQNPSLPSVSFTTPGASGPVNGTTYKFKQQPVTLAIAHATVTGAAAVTYTVEVSTSPAFASLTQTREGIVQASGGTTNVTLSSLAGGATYYWRTRTMIDGIAGEPSTVSSFVVQPQVLLGTPEVDQPAPASSVSTTRPVFQVRNGSRSGPVGAITYEFEVSTAATFATVVARATGIAEVAARTSWTPAVDLPMGNLFWRARAVDVSNEEVSPFTGAVAFSVTAFDVSKAIFMNAGTGVHDIKTFTEASAITLVDFSAGRIVVDFDKRTGPNRWPDTRTPGWDGDLQYSLGLCLRINEQWYCGIGARFWFGRDLTEGGDVNRIAQDWFYDNRWGPMNGYQPRPGELVAIFTVAGNHKDVAVYTVKERSNVVVLPWLQNYRK